MTTPLKMPANSILLVLLALATGCGGGQTGDLSGQNDKQGGTGVESSPCEDQARDIALDDASDLGFSAQSVLAFAARRFDAPLAWQSIDGVQYSPGAGQSTLTLTLSAAGGAAFVHSVPSSGTSGSGPGIEIGCPSDRLELPVHAELSTADGAFLESFDGTVVASGAVSANFRYVVDPGLLRGSFKVGTIDASVLPGTGGSVELGNVTLDATLTPAGISGALNAQVTSTGPELAAAKTLTMGRLQ